MRTTGQPYRKHTGIEGDFDAIVVGSGMGGMTAAVMLAKQGKAVLLLEQNSVVGGLTQTYERGGYRWSTGLHYIGDVAHPKTMTHRLFDYVTDGQIEWAPMPETYNKMVIGDRTFAVPAGREAYTAALKDWFPAEADAIDRYMDLVFAVSKTSAPYFGQKAIPHALVQPALEDMCAPFHRASDQLTRDALLALTDNEDLIAVLCGNWGDYSSPPHRSSFAMHCMLNKHYMNGGSYPVGGAGRLADAMMPIVEAAGGQVFHSAEVAHILIGDGRAQGVMLSSGEKVSAPVIISNAGVQNTFGRLMGEDAAAAAGLDQCLDAVEDTYALVGINLGLNCTGDELGLSPQNIWAHPGPDFKASLDAHKADFNAPFPWHFITFPSVKDPVWDEEFPGKSTIEMYAYTNFEHFSAWADTRWRKRGGTYEARKDAIKERLLAELEKYVPDVRGAIDVCEVSTPLTYETFTKRQRGGFMGIESTPGRFRQTWLRAATPIKGLYLTGQDVTTDGVIGALMGGVISASAVLGKDLLAEIRSGA